MKTGTLYLLPNLIGPFPHHEPFLPKSVGKAVGMLDGLIAESEREGRRYLDRFETKKPSRETPIALFNEHTPDQDIDFYLDPIKNGEHWGFLSDAGLPCIADPGHQLVHRARKVGIPIKAFVGPSSIMLALMLSGLNGQKFMFHGYLPKEQQSLRQEINSLQKRAEREQATQIFMERPYRNQQLLEMLMEELSDETELCLAWELTTPDQGVLTQTVKQWKGSPLPNLHKRNTIFLLR